MTQGIGLRPQPWARFSRPVGPDSVGLPLPPPRLLAVDAGAHEALREECSGLPPPPTEE